MKMEIRNSNIEIRNKSEIRIGNVQNSLAVCRFGNSKLFRISDFGFRILIVLLFALPVRADQAAMEKAVRRGTEYLLSRQDQDGAIGKVDRKSRDNANAMTGLAILALTATGHQPSDDTTEGRAVRKALEFILEDERQDKTGYFGKYDGSRMYGHGIVTLMLAEMLGMGLDAKQDALIRERCQRAIDLIVRSQKIPKSDQRFHGGWRYTPEARDADLSVTVWQVMALRAAKNAGLSVPRETIEDAIRFIKRSYRSDRDRRGRITNQKSGFAYEPGQWPVYSTASEGLLALQVCGEYDAPELRGTVEWLREEKVSSKHRWFFYGTYYYAQGMYQCGGEAAKEAREGVERVLLAEQQEDGSWIGKGEEGNSRVYCTSLALMSLSVRHHFMPIYQR